MVERLFRSREVAELLDVHVMTVNRLRLSGQLGFIRVGRSVRFTQRHIDDFLTRQERRPIAAHLPAAEQAAAVG